MAETFTSTALAELPGISLQDDFRFRKGQRAFLEKWAMALAEDQANQLGVFVPGYGKTITALAAFVVARSMGKAQKLVVFVPRGNLRDQYANPDELAQTFEWLGTPGFTYAVADSDKVFLKNLNTEIVITTYQYASGDGGRRALEKFSRTAPCLFVFDEVHHLAEDGTWATKIDTLNFACSVGLSGTPMRSDGKPLFGVPLETREDGEEYYEALHEVTMRDAHSEGGILKRVDAHVIDYQLQLVRGDTGEMVELSLSEMREIAEDEEIDTYLARRRMRFHDEYLSALLDPAFERFADKRKERRRRATDAGNYTFRNHQMLVIAMSNRHAAAMLEFVKERYPRFISTRIGQDVPAGEREQRLAKYRRGEIDVMVQVDMIGEGTDIKPISVVVKADLVRAFSKTMQQVFRAMRYFDGFSEEGNRCDIYAANDSDVVHTLNWIASEEQAGVKVRKEQADRETPVTPPDTSDQSPWELTDVRRGVMKSHNLDRFQEQRRRANRPKREMVDVNAREKELRKQCAELASELAYSLQARGQNVSIRQVHGRAKKRFSKAQGELSLSELTRKKNWLERCVRANRFI